LYFREIAGSFPVVQENKKPTGGIEPPTFRLQSECSTTKLSRHTVGMAMRATRTYGNLPIAQLAERETVDGVTTDISRSLVRIRVGRIFCVFIKQTVANTEQKCQRAHQRDSLVSNAIFQVCYLTTVQGRC
jgi:hypothetical protein